MNTTVERNTRGILQITRQSDKVWTCTVVFYGAQKQLRKVDLTTAEVVKLFRTLGTPAPVSQKDRHIVEFHNTPDWAALESLGFVAR